MSTSVAVPTPSSEVAGPAVAVPDRRSFLRTLALAGTTVLVAGTGVASYRVFDNGVLDAGSGAPYDPWQHWDTDPGPRGAVAAAVLAANPHNTQPWVFDVGDGVVDVLSDPSRSMPQVDPLRREHHVGLGCAVENLTLALAARGLLPQVALAPDPASPGLVARVRFAPGKAVRSPEYAAIGARHSDRGPYRRTAVAGRTLEALAAAGLPGVRVRWFTSPADRAALGALLVAAAESFVADDGQSRDAFRWFRNDRDAIDAHRDGPTLDAQGLDSVTLSLAKILPATSRRAGDRFWVEQTRTVHTATAAAYGVVLVDDATDLAQRLTGGRLLQRVHLRATAAGLSLQHMNQVTEAVDRERAGGLPPAYADRFRAVLGGEGEPLVTFRVGHPVRAARPSPRRAVEDVLR